MDIRVGDTVRVVCCDWSRIDKDSKALRNVVGKVVSVFNALDKEGDNWFIEIKGEAGWFLYKPRIDGGTISVLKRAK